MALPPLSLNDVQYLVNMAKIRFTGMNIHKMTNKCHWVVWVSRRFSETGRIPESVDPIVYAKDITELRRIAGI